MQKQVCCKHHRCPKFPLVDWLKSRGLKLPLITTAKWWCRWYTIFRPLYQKDMIGKRCRSMGLSLMVYFCWSLKSKFWNFSGSWSLGSLLFNGSNGSRADFFSRKKWCERYLVGGLVAFFSHILGFYLSQLTSDSYFSEGWLLKPPSSNMLGPPKITSKSSISKHGIHWWNPHKMSHQCRRRPMTWKNHGISPHDSRFLPSGA